MSNGSFDGTRWRHRVTWGIAGLIVLSAAVVAIVGPATAAITKKNYTTSFAPLYAGAGTTATYRLTLANDGSSNTTLGSANFQIPSQLTASVVAVNPPSPGQLGWTVTIVGGVLQFRSATSHDAMTPGQFMSVDLSVTTPGLAPLGAACFDYTWHSAVKQSNTFSGTGNDFNLKGSDAALTVSQLVFTTEPPTQVTIAPSTFSATVSAEDGCGNLLPAATGTVNLALATNPVSGTLGGTVSKALTGSATFGDLTVDSVGTGYQLGASMNWGVTGDDSSTTSTPFDVLSTICTARNCHAQDNPNTPTTLVDATVPGGAQLGVGFPTNMPFSCNGSGTPVGSLVVIDPSGYPAGNYTVTITLKKSVTGTGPASGFEVCLSKDNGGTWTEPLSACPTTADHQCIVSQKRTQLGDLQIVLRLAPGDPTGGAS
jgi:hypothetical protein